MKKIKFINYLSILLLLLQIVTAKAQYEFPSCYPAYDPGHGAYTAGEQVSLNGINYQCAYYVATPPPSPGWTTIGACGDGGLGPDYNGPQRIIGYLPYWVPDYDLVNDFDPSVVTHLNIAFNLFKQNNNNFNSADFASIQWADFHKRKVDSLLFDLNILNRAHHAGVTVSVAIGGATDFAFIWLMERYYQNDAKLEEIANFIVNYVNTTGIDGVDLDMECWWPDAAISGTVEKGGRIRGDKWGGTDQGPEPAAIGLTKLAQKLRQKMPNKLLSAAVFGTSWYGNNYDDALADHLNWLGLMTYDFTGSWDKSPKGPHSSLYKVPLAYPGQSADNPIYSAQDALEYWMGLAPPAWNHDGGFNVPKAKLAMGVPLYGYDFSQEKPDNGNGYVAVPYRNIVAAHPNAATSYDPLDSHHLGGKVDQIYYNTPVAGAAKITYSANYGHQGVIIWELTQDVPFTSNSSIMKAINDAAGNDVGTPPSVSITSPQSNTQFNEGAAISITAAASDADGTVLKVDFYADDALIGTATTSPYSVSWHGATPGTHNLKAIATDNDNKTGSSTIVPIQVIYTPVLTSIVVAPANSSIPLGDTQQFTAQGYDQTGAAITVSVTWSATGGSINTSGLFTGSSIGNYTVTATSGQVSGTATINVADNTPVLTTIVVSPSNPTINEGGTQQFSAQGYDQFNNPMNATVSWSATINSINSSGLYVGNVVGNDVVTATSGSISGTATVTVAPLGGCDAPQYVAGTTYATGADVSNNDTKYNCKVGGWCSSSAAWAYEPGAGMYWQDAWTEVGPCTITVPVLTTISVTPASVSINLNATQQFTAQGYDQNGNAMSVSVTWSASGGSINTSGIYTGSALGTFSVTATSGVVSGSAGVTVSDQTPVLTSIVVSPSTASIDEGTTQQFSAQGYDQNGNAMNTSVSWTTTGNSISSSGLYTGTSAGSYIVTATSGTISGNANVTVTPSGGCNSPAWSATTTYVKDNVVSHSNHEWRAKWWTLNEEPGTTGEWGVWEDQGVCSTLKSTKSTGQGDIFSPISNSTINIYPNPFAHTLNFEFKLEEESTVSMKVYTESGAIVKTLINNKLPAGNHSYTFDGSNLKPGIYFYRFISNDSNQIGRIVKE